MAVRGLTVPCNRYLATLGAGGCAAAIKAAQLDMKVRVRHDVCGAEHFAAAAARTPHRLVHGLNLRLAPA